MTMLLEERPIDLIEPAQVLERVGSPIVLPAVDTFGAFEQFVLRTDHAMPFSEIGKDFRSLFKSTDELNVLSVTVSVRRLIGPWANDSILAVIGNDGANECCLSLAHVYEYLKIAERGECDPDSGERPPWYVFYCVSWSGKHEISSVRAVWHDKGWSMTASPATCDLPWDEDEEIFVIAPDS